MRIPGTDPGQHGGDIFCEKSKLNNDRLVGDILFAVESIAACVLFTVLLEIATFHRREVFVNDYPPVVTEKLRQMGLIAEKPPAKRNDMIRKMIAFMVYASIVLRMLADKKITVNNTICDGGITPYQIPWLLTRFINEVPSGDFKQLNGLAKQDGGDIFAAAYYK